MSEYQSRSPFSRPPDNSPATPAERAPLVPSKPRERYQWKDGIERAPRPMDFYLEEVLEKLGTNQVVVVQAETGVGKTTRIPQALLDHDPDAKIFMTQTKRPPVRMNGGFIAQEMKTRPGDKVGWSLRGEQSVTSTHTKLTLLIDQSLTNRIRREKKLPEGYIIIDEAHERTVQIDILLALIKEYLPTSPKTKVLVTSATIDTEKFKNFFNAAEPVIAFNEQLYPVEVKPFLLGHGEHHTEGAYRALESEVLTTWAKGELTIPGKTATEPPTKVTSGSVLVLLPGKDDINAVMHKIERQAARLEISDKVEILACHGQMQKHEQDLVSRPVREGVLRIVCATEIIRSSVTVPSVVGVVDSLQVKRHSTDKNGVTHLGKVTISGAEADQGKGRAGREQPGFYTPVSFNNEYSLITNRNSEKYWPIPAIQRESLTSVILQIAAVDLSIRSLQMLDKPDNARIDTAIARLQKLGALDDKEEITELGRILVNFPVNPERARVLISAEKLNILPEAIIASAILENEGIQFVPNKNADTPITLDEKMMRHVLTALAKRRASGYYTKTEMPDLSGDLTNALPSWVSKIGPNEYFINPKDPQFSYDYGMRELATEIWKYFAEDSQSDFYAGVQAYRAFKAEQQRLRQASDAELGFSKKDTVSQNARKRRIEDRERQWCVNHFLNYKKIQFIDATVRDLSDEVEQSPLTLQDNVYQFRKFSADDLTKALISGLVDNVAYNRSGNYSGPMASDISVSYSSTISSNTAQAEYILIGGVRKSESSGRHGSLYFSDLNARIEPDWLQEVMPQLCSSRVLENKAQFDRATGQVMATKETFYGDVPLKSEQVALNSEAASSVLARAVFNGITGHPHEAENRARLARAKELLNRNMMSTADLDQKVIQWYEKKLAGITTAAEIMDIDLSLTDVVFSIFLKTSYTEFTQKTLAEKPDEVTVLGTKYPVTYIRQSSLVMGAYLKLPPQVVTTLNWSDIPPFGDVNVVITVEGLADHMYNAYKDTTDSLEKLKQKIENKRLDSVWYAFIDAQTELEATAPPDAIPNRYQLKDDETFPPLPEPKVWDAASQALAYPAYSYINLFNQSNPTVWKIAWFRTQQEALEAQNKAQTTLETIKKAAYEREHFEELKTQAQTLYTSLKERLDTILKQELSLYGLTQEEVTSYSGSSPSLRSRLSRAHELSGLSYSQARPVQALEELNKVEARLATAEAFFETNGKAILALRQEEESIARPEIPEGVFPLFVYRTKNGMLVGSPTVGTTGSGRSARESRLVGLGSTELEAMDPVAVEQINRAVAPTRNLRVAPSSRWYILPESGTARFEEPTLSGNRIDIEYTFSWSDIPREPGMYVLNIPGYMGRTATAETTYALPTSYNVIEEGVPRTRVATNMYEVVQWLETVNYGLRRQLTFSLLGIQDENKPKTLVQAKKILEQASAEGKKWLLEQTLIGDDETKTPDQDPVDEVLQKNGLGEITNLENPRTAENLLEISNYILSNLPTKGMVALARIQIAALQADIAQHSDAKTRIATEIKLLQLAKKYEIRVPDRLIITENKVENNPVQSSQTVEKEPEKPTPKLLRIERLNDLLVSHEDTLAQILDQQKTADQGEWRHAYAALAAKGPEARNRLRLQGLQEKTIQDVLLTLKKTLAEARTERYPELSRAERELDRVSLAVQQLSLILATQKNPLIAEYFGNDEANKAEFWSRFITRLDQQTYKWDMLPSVNNLDKLVEAVVEEMTS